MQRKGAVWVFLCTVAAACSCIGALNNLRADANAAAYVSIVQPRNGSYILADAVDIEFRTYVALDDKEAAKERVVCIQIVSTLFDRRMPGCVAADSRTLTLGKLPYGAHRIHLCLAHAQRTDAIDVSSCARVFVHVVPILPPPVSYTHLTLPTKA